MSGSNPNWPFGYVPPPSEWNTWWGNKVDGAGGQLTGGSLTNTDISSALVTSSHGSTARSPAARAADVFNAADYGFKPSATASANLTALQAIATDVNSLNGTGAHVFIPAGTYNVAAGTVTFLGNGITLGGAGQQATLLLTANVNTDFLVIQPSATSQRATGIHVHGFRVFNTDNLMTAGALLKLNRVQFSRISDVEIDGGFRSLRMIGCQILHGNNITCAGNNNNAGSACVENTQSATVVNTSNSTASGTTLFFSDTSAIYLGDAVTGTNIHSGSTVSSIVANTSVTLSAAVDGSISNGQAITFTSPESAGHKYTNCEWRGTNVYTNALIIGQADGFYVSNSHIGFSTAECVLIQPANTPSLVAGIHFSNTDFDTGQYGVRFAPLGGYTGKNELHSFAGCLSQIQSADGFRIDDSSVQDVRITGHCAMDCQNNGINLQAGTNISITGGSLYDNNLSNGGFSHVLIGGTTSYVAVSGLALHKKSASTGVAYNVSIAGTVNHVAIGACSYKDAVTGNYNVTTSGADITISAGASDQTTDRWSFKSNYVDSQTRTLSVDDGSIVAKIHAFTANSVEAVTLESRPSGAAGPQIYPSQGGNAPMSIYANGTGKLNLGISSNGAVLLNTYRADTAVDALTASGTTRLDALVLSHTINHVTTAASGTGVVLPLGIAGMVIDIFNDGASPIKVYGSASGSDTIDGVAPATGVTLSNAKRCRYTCVATGVWISAQFGVASA